MKAVIDAQWFAVQMATFSRAADVMEKLDRECDNGPRIARMVPRSYKGERAGSSEDEA